MEALRKRRASAELHDLMSEVKGTYELFGNFDTTFQQPLPVAKRQRLLSDNSLLNYGTTSSQGFDRVQSKYADKRRQNGWSIDKLYSSKSDDVFIIEKTEELARAHQKTSLDSWFEKPPKTSTTFTSRLTRIGPQTSSQRRYDPWPELRTPVEFLSVPSQPRLLTDAIPPFPRDNVDVVRTRVSKQEYSKFLFQDAMDSLAENDSDNVPPIVRRRSSIGKDGIQSIQSSQSGNDKMPASEAVVPTTRIIYGGMPPIEGFACETTFRAARESAGEYEAMSDVEKYTTEEKYAGPTQQLAGSRLTEEIGRVFDKAPKKLSTQRKSRVVSSNGNSSNEQLMRALLEDDHVVTSSTNEEAEQSSQQIIQVRDMSPEARSLQLKPSAEVWPNYIITRVGSLLCLGKDRVHPITLDEIRRRVQAPENFSFQMLIAYVRHSRAKGRQFLNYWNCQPTGKTSNPNVLSKLCEADAKELVEGIRHVNEEYFPSEKLARNAAEMFLDSLGKRSGRSNAGQGPLQESCIRDKVESIRKSRSVLRTLQETLKNSQNDEKFETFNIASHNAGLDNIKYNLRFLDDILAKVQTHIGRGHRNFASFTG